MIKTLCSLLCGMMLFAASSHAQSDTAFTYQGTLTGSGEPLSGTVEIEFSLWDAPTSGTQIGSTDTHPSVDVENGLFVASLDFGASVFADTQRWLELTVEGFTLFPRQAMTRSPYAVQTRGIFVDDNMRVGIGTTAPQHELHIEGPRPTLNLTATENNITAYPTLRFTGAPGSPFFQSLGALEFHDDTGAFRGSINAAKSGPSATNFNFVTSDGGLPRLQIFESHTRVIDALELRRSSDLELAASIGTDGHNSVFQLQGGNVGIGTESPGALLDVNGESHFSGRITGFNGARFAGGNVGVGTYSPSYPLDVWGDAQFNHLVGIGGNPSGFSQLTIADDGAAFGLSVESSQTAFPAILATNAGAGPVLWALGTDDVALGGGGLIVAGYETGTNIAIDNNEIMARNNGSPATLHLNADGGPINMGEHDIHPAWAYGSINRDGTVASSSSNLVSVSHSPGQYTLTFTEPIRTTDVTLATPGSSSASDGFFAGWTFSGTLQVGSDNDDFGFSFVVFRP